MEKRVYAYTGDPNDPWPATPTEVRRFVWGGGSAGVSPANGGWLLLAEYDGLASNALARSYSWGLDLAGQSGAAVAPVSDRWLEGVAPVSDRWNAAHGGAALQGAGGIGGLLAVHDPNSPSDPNDPFGDFVYTYDANGNVGQVVNWSADPNAPAAAIVARYQYDPYGNRINHDPNTPEYDQPFRFSTKQFNAETGLIYFGHRYYDPKQGRWTTWDPIGETGGVSLYAFVVNSPADAVDPLGMIPLDGPGIALSAPTPIGCCGPDIGHSLQQFLWRLDALIGSVQKDPCRMARMCVNMVSKAGWDIFQLRELGLSGRVADPTFYQAGCSTANCEGTVRLYGRCYRANEMNYILWGRMNRACRESLSSWATPAIVKMGRKRAAQNRGWQVDPKCAYGRMSSDIFVNGRLPVAVFTRGWMLLAIDYHRLWAGRDQNGREEAAGPAGPGDISCRQAWAVMGYEHD